MPNNPLISPLLRWVTAFECVVLIICGGGLFLLPSVISPLWPWELTPFNTRFLGAIYLASLLSAALLVVYGRWTPARIVTPLILLFTLVVLIVSLTYLSRFTVPVSTLFWLLLYGVIPLNAAYHLWRYRHLPPAPSSAHIPAWLRTFFRVQAVLFGLYGIGLLIEPTGLTTFWPWTIDTFHGRMYSVAFLTPALGAWLVAQSATRIDLQTIGWTQVLGGVLPIWGAVIVSATLPAERQIQWGAAGTLLWLSLGVLLIISGGLMLWRSRR